MRTFQPRSCVRCTKTFTPNSGQQRFCSYDCRRASRIETMYGLEIGEWQQRFKTQRGRCALCGATARGWRRGEKALHVDHDHVTGHTRGLLCGDCNTAIGRFGDDPDRLRAAAQYIEEHRERTKHLPRRERPTIRHLSPQEVTKIRKRLRAGELGSALAAEFGVSQSLISTIRRGGKGYDGSPIPARSGQGHWAARLTDDDVRAARRRYAEGGVSQGDVAKAFNVSQPCMNAVLNRKGRFALID